MQLKIHKAGMHTSIQDEGRFGFQSYGVPVSGAMDKFSYRLANEILNNPKNTPVLEMTMIGPKIEFLGDCQIAMTGAHLSPRINKVDTELNKLIDVKTGDLLTFGKIRAGCRCYLAIRGVWGVNDWLGSHSSFSLGGQNLPKKSKINNGDVIEIKISEPIQAKFTQNQIVNSFETDVSIGILKGPDFEKFSRLDLDQFFTKKFTIGIDSSRMAYLLDENIKDYKPSGELISSGVISGTIQITNSGQPIILMRDAQTTGGYFRIGNIVESNLNHIAQLKPGDKIGFYLKKYFLE